MKKIFSLAAMLITISALHAQSYIQDIGSSSAIEKLGDVLVFGPQGSQTTIIAGTTNAFGLDQIMITSTTTNYPVLIYQKRIAIAVVAPPAEYCVVNSVKLAYDEASGSSNFNMAGSFTRQNFDGTTVYGYGLFTATVNISTGNVVSMKRWESMATGVTQMTVGAMCASGSNFYVSGNVRYGATSDNKQFVYALNSSNNVVWSKIETCTSHLGDLNVVDMLYSPYQPIAVPELVIVGSTRQRIFVRRVNASTGAVISQTMLNPTINVFHEATSIIPSLSASGVADGFLICGTREVSLRNCGWVTKINTTANAVTWSRFYRYNVGATHFNGADIVAAEYDGDQDFYFSGTAMNGITGPTYDEAVFCINSSGAIQSLYTLDPTAVATNKNETTKIIRLKKGTLTRGFCTFGTRAPASNPGLSDIYAVGYTAFVTPDIITCDNTISTPYAGTTVSLTVSTITTADYSTLVTGTLLQSPSALNNFVQYCFEDYSVGMRLQTTGFHEDEIAGATVLAFPNPTTGLITLSRNSNVAAQVTVFDLSGRVVVETQLMTGTTMSLDLSSQEAGAYIVNVVSEHESRSIRVVKE